MEPWLYHCGTLIEIAMAARSKNFGSQKQEKRQ
jgi:hypothetical protein